MNELQLRIPHLQLDAMTLTKAAKEKCFSQKNVIGIGKRLGGTSVHGAVFEIYMKPESVARGQHPNTLYVAKFVPIASSQFPTNERNSFITEVNVGSNPELSKQEVGPSIVAYYMSKNKGPGEYGVYIMDNFLKGKDPTLYSSKYLYTHIENTCPRSNSLLVKKLRENVIKFYKITGGYHGDLHGNNIQVVKNIRTNEVKHVYIFDYGSHTKFRARNYMKRCNTLAGALSLVNKEFTANATNPKRKTGTVVQYQGMPVIYSNNRQGRMANRNLLESLGATYKNMMKNKNL